MLRGGATAYGSLSVKIMCVGTKIDPLKNSRINTVL